MAIRWAIRCKHFSSPKQGHVHGNNWPDKGARPLTNLAWWWGWWRTLACTERHHLHVPGARTIHRGGRTVTPGSGHHPIFSDVLVNRENPKYEPRSSRHRRMGHRVGPENKVVGIRRGRGATAHARTRSGRSGYDIHRIDLIDAAILQNPNVCIKGG